MTETKFQLIHRQKKIFYCRIYNHQIFISFATAHWRLENAIVTSSSEVIGILSTVKVTIMNTWKKEPLMQVLPRLV